MSSAIDRLQRLNALPSELAENEFLACCHSPAWARRMTDARPFASVDALLDTADRTWWRLDSADWLEAFAGHPRIGERPSVGAVKSNDDDGGAMRSAQWAAQEQSGAQGAPAATATNLATLNRAYEDRFGYTFIVCATGKSADEMLAILKRRLGNDPDVELKTAAEEQRRITRLRLVKLL